jgi:hypothetical protein
MTTSDDAMAQWAARRSVKQSPKTPYCVCRLLDKVCSVYGTSGCTNGVPEVDHPSLWIRDGKAVIFVSQPYGLVDVARLGAFCMERNLTCMITTWPAWHNPGSVLHVEITRRGA